MLHPIKLFFDECCSPKLPRKLVEVYEEDYPLIATRHLTDIFKKGIDDQDWLSVLKNEPDWIVVTADRGKDSKKPKLPLICSKLGITHISMTPDLKNAGYSAHKQALLSTWPQIAMIPLIPRGTRVSLGYRNVNKGASKIPWISIDQVAFDIWCSERNITASNVGLPPEALGEEYEADADSNEGS
jgi:hypothetical protein